MTTNRQPTCGARTLKDAPCDNPVTVAGTGCHHHPGHHVATVPAPQALSGPPVCPVSAVDAGAKYLARPLDVPTPAQFTCTAATIYAYGHNGDAAALVASDLRKEARDKRATAAARGPGYSWVTEDVIASCLDNANRREQAAAIIDELMPLGRAAVEMGCSFIGSDLAPSALVELVTGMSAALLAAPARVAGAAS